MNASPLLDFVITPNGFGIVLALIAVTVGGLALVFSLDYMRGEAQQRRYYVLIAVFIGAMCGLVLTDSLFWLFVFWEITGVCSYLLISFHNENPAAVAGGIRAIIVTQIGGMGLLIGILLIWTYLGTDQINDVLAGAQQLPPGILALAAFGFLVAAAAKSAQVPFHIWLPGAMEAPTPVSALIHAATMVNAGVYLLARFYPAFSAVPGWTNAVALIGLISALLGAVMALAATDLKRVLAYSTISQLGFMVYAVGIGAIFASQFHLLSHAVFKALLFLAAGAVIHATGTRDLRQLGGLRDRMPFTHLAFLVGATGLIGIPVFNGFWSKELILDQSMKSGPAWASWLLLIVVGLTALYTIRTVWLVFYGPARNVLHSGDAPFKMRLALGVLSIGTATTWLLAAPFAALLKATLPFHEIELENELISVVLHSPVTWVSLAVVGLAGVVWAIRKRIARYSPDISAVQDVISADFGFERLTRLAAAFTQHGAEQLRTLQTGQVNWNVAQIIVCLVVVLAVLAIGRVT